ncbi:flavodoxin domain-containing protein [Burkholderia sp. Ac-20344]|uniref:flavodoxin domain-containing protein n=1 Tax=Burkholderia sp. Ac-20344 TaxID=2703890 RepID=UPI00197B299D|nr:flavodoxin domain-containing protein [Burkholderia sp. Ac-20344]MBN3836726.1 nitric oxide synthase [Burkholderia sp. Ac-20344]
MESIVILFGTESGNAEMAADDIASALEALDIDTQVVPMNEFDVSTLPAAGTAILISSTYGEGAMPETAEPFYKKLLADRPDLRELRFAAFGLGDSTYKTFNNAIDTLVVQVESLGASQVGSTGRHDASSGKLIADVASEWVTSTFGRA